MPQIVSSTLQWHQSISTVTILIFPDFSSKCNIPLTQNKISLTFPWPWRILFSLTIFWPVATLSETFAPGKMGEYVCQLFLEVYSVTHGVGHLEETNHAIKA